MLVGDLEYSKNRQKNTNKKESAADFSIANKQLMLLFSVFLFCKQKEDFALKMEKMVTTKKICITI